MTAAAAALATPAEATAAWSPHRTGHVRKAAFGLSAVLALAAAGASVLLRLPFLAVPLTGDEAGYAYVAHWLSRGLSLYRELWFDRPQGIFLVYAAILRLFGPTTEAIRLAAGVYNAGTTLLLSLLAARLCGRPAALAAGALFAVASAAPAIEGFTANGELLMNLPVLGALLLAHAGRPGAAGAALALATAIKPSALPSAGPAVVVLLLHVGRGAAPAPGHWRRRLPPVRRLLRAVAGGTAAAAPFVAHGVAAGPAAYWYAVAGFRLEAHSAFAAGGRFLDDLRQSAPQVGVGVLPVWLLVGFWLASRGWRERHGAALLAFLLGSLTGAALGGSWYWHYFVGVLPAAALIAGRELARHSQRALNTPRGAGTPPSARRAARTRLAVVGVTAVVAVVFNVGFLGATPEETSWRLYREPGYLTSRAAAAYLRERTAPDETVYAAFTQPDLYYLSERRSAGAHLYWTEINRVPGAFDAVVAALDDPVRAPRYVVRVQTELEEPGRATRFWSHVERCYQREATFGSLVLYRRRDGEPVVDGGATGAGPAAARDGG